MTAARSQTAPPGPAPAGVPASAGRVPSSRVLVWLLLAAVSMLFTAFTSNYVIQRAQADWQLIPLPPVLWASTAALIASSASLEAARRHLRRPGAADPGRARRWIALTAGLGLAFLAGQVAAWQALAAAGVFLQSNPHSSFFYLLTAVHGLHLLGGLVVLGALLLRAAAGDDARRLLVRAVGPAATYWHFMGGLWVYLFILLFWT